MCHIFSIWLGFSGHSLLNKVDKEHHREIYRFLRTTRPANFFSSNYIDTRFNIYMLSESEIENLDYLISFCLESMRNKEEYLESAKKFRDNVEKLKPT